VSQADPSSSSSSSSGNNGNNVPRGRGLAGLGGFRLFGFAGINVYLHWTWLLVAVYQVSRPDDYRSPLWKALEYLALFVIVLLHEFGHAFACRSVGGKADRIVLWPLGGIAFVSPPMRPGAWLWSIVAGPLVNVALLPLTIGVYLFLSRTGVSSDVELFVWRVAWINALLLIFNLLPIYPLDGGKIVWSLLWYVIGQAHALMVASIIGLVGTAAGVLLLIALVGVKGLDFLLLLVVGFVVLQSINGLKQAKAMARALALPRNFAYVCPSCRQSPPLNVGWRCRQCGQVYDLFGTAATCPQCGTRVDPVPCPLCGAARSLNAWIAQAPLSPPGFQPVMTTARR
jgi:Zn-dependent protease